MEASRTTETIETAHALPSFPTSVPSSFPSSSPTTTVGDEDEDAAAGHHTDAAMGVEEQGPSESMSNGGDVPHSNGSHVVANGNSPETKHERNHKARHVSANGNGGAPQKQGQQQQKKNHKGNYVTAANGKAAPQQPKNNSKAAQAAAANGNSSQEKKNHKVVAANGNAVKNNHKGTQGASNGNVPKPQQPKNNHKGNHVAKGKSQSQQHEQQVNHKVTTQQQQQQGQGGSTTTRGDVPQQRKYKGNYVAPDWEPELTYAKVLRAARASAEPSEGELVTQFPPSHLASSDSALTRKPQAGSDNLKLAPWQRVLSFVRKDNSAAKAENNGVERYWPTCNLNDEGIAAILERLVDKFGRGTSSSFLDDSYSIYLPEDGQAAVCFKVAKGVAVMYGDALCAADRMAPVFEAFRKFCKQQKWQVAVVGAGQSTAAYAKGKHWRTMEFAVEQVLNPVTNGILDGSQGKTINRVNRRIVESGVKLKLYEPTKGIRPELEKGLMAVYNSWRDDRRARNAPQAYSAVINPFAMPAVSRYLYTLGSNGKPNSLCGLIRIGSNNGYLLEPCIALPGTPKGLTDFLVTHAMGLLRDENVQYLTFGLEALPEMGEITRFPYLISENSRLVYKTIFKALGLGGRKIFHEKFHPDEDQKVRLYLLFPPGFPTPSVLKAVLKVTNISAREVWSRSQGLPYSSRKRSKQESTSDRPDEKEDEEKLRKTCWVCFGGGRAANAIDRSRTMGSRHEGNGICRSKTPSGREETVIPNGIATSNGGMNGKEEVIPYGIHKNKTPNGKQEVIPTIETNGSL